MCNVNIAVVLLYKHVLADLISTYHQYYVVMPWSRLRDAPIYEGIVKAKLEDELAQLCFRLGGRTLTIVRIRCEHAQGVYGLSIHGISRKARQRDNERSAIGLIPVEVVKSSEEGGRVVDVTRVKCFVGDRQNVIPERRQLLVRLLPVLIRKSSGSSVRVPLWSTAMEQCTGTFSLNPLTMITGVQLVP